MNIKFQCFQGFLELDQAGQMEGEYYIGERYYCSLFLNWDLFSSYWESDLNTNALIGKLNLEHRDLWTKIIYETIVKI